MRWIRPATVPGMLLAIVVWGLLFVLTLLLGGCSSVSYTKDGARVHVSRHSIGRMVEGERIETGDGLLYSAARQDEVASFAKLINSAERALAVYSLEKTVRQRDASDAEVARTEIKSDERVTRALSSDSVRKKALDEATELARIPPP